MSRLKFNKVDTTTVVPPGIRYQGAFKETDENHCFLLMLLSLCSNTERHINISHKIQMKKTSQHSHPQ